MNTDTDNFDKINKEYLKEMKELNENIENSKKGLNLNEISVDSFCMKYTSDELESLKDIFHVDNRKRLSRNFWMFEQEHVANEKLKEIKSYCDKFLALPSEPNRHFEIPRVITADTDAKNSLFFPPDFSNTNKRNEINQVCIKPTENTNHFSENIDKFNDKRTITENTRLPENFMENLIEKDSEKFRRKIMDVYENSDVVKLIREIHELEEKKQENKTILPTPTIRGYKLLKEPKPIPGQIDQVPLFTWGEIASTPNILKESPKFTIQQFSTREDIAHKLANKALNTKRQRDQIDNKTNNIKTVKSNSKSYDLTPNAMKLLKSVKRNTSSSIFDNSDKTPLINPKDKKTDLLNRSSFTIRSIKK